MSISSLSLIYAGTELGAVGAAKVIDELEPSATADTIDEVADALSDKTDDALWGGCTDVGTEFESSREVDADAGCEVRNAIGMASNTAVTSVTAAVVASSFKSVPTDVSVA
jgi:hypothetical protein